MEDHGFWNDSPNKSNQIKQIEALDLEALPAAKPNCGIQWENEATQESPNRGQKKSKFRLRFSAGIICRAHLGSNPDHASILEVKIVSVRRTKNKNERNGALPSGVMFQKLVFFPIYKG